MSLLQMLINPQRDGDMDLGLTISFYLEVKVEKNCLWSNLYVYFLPGGLLVVCNLEFGSLIVNAREHKQLVELKP